MNTAQKLVSPQELEIQVDQLSQENESLRARIRELEEQISKLGSTPVAVKRKSLNTLLEEALPRWEGKLIVTPAAIRAAKKSIYAEPEEVIAALDLLAVRYPQMRAGQVSREEWTEELRSKLMEDRGTVGTRWESSGLNDPLFIQYKGRRTLMDRHICKGNSTDSRRCMRLYYFWDTEAKTVVVGHLPNHLPGRVTDNLGL